MNAKLKKASSEGDDEADENRILSKSNEENQNQSFQFNPDSEDKTSQSFIDLSQGFSFGNGDQNSSANQRKIYAKHYAKKPLVPVVVTTDSKGNVLTINGSAVAKNTIVASSVASKVLSKEAEEKVEEKVEKKVEKSVKTQEKSASGQNSAGHNSAPVSVDPNRFHGDSGLPSSSKRSKRKKDQAFSNTVDQEDTGGYTEPDTNIDGSLVVPDSRFRGGIPHQRLTDPAAIEARRRQVAENVARATAAQNHAHILHTHLSHHHSHSTSRSSSTMNSKSQTKNIPTSSATIGIAASKLGNLGNTLGVKAKVTTTRRVGNSRQIAAYQASRDSLRLAEARRKMSMEKTNKKNREAWEEKEREERQKIKEFWLGLSDSQRKELVRLEKEAVLKKMKEQQKHTCSCSVCGRRRTVIEEELEMLYDAYYEELENFEGQNSSSKSSSPSNLSSSSSSTSKKVLSSGFLGPFHKENGENSEESFSFAKSLTVKGGILTVADDLLKNEGKKFLEMMEKLAERRMRKEDEEAEDGEEYDREENEKEHNNNVNHENENENDDEEETDEEYPEESGSVFDDEDNDDPDDDEGRRMFQMFAAKMFEQRVLTAYREKVAYENQKKLLEDLEKEKRLEREKQEANLLKQKEKQEQARLKKLEAEELKQRQRKEQEELQKKQEEEKRRKQEEEKQRRLEEQKRQKELSEQKKLAEEEQRKKNEQKKEELRLKKEEEKLKKQQEEALKQLESVTLEENTQENDFDSVSSENSSVTSQEAKSESDSLSSSSSSKKKKKKKSKKPQQSLPQNRYLGAPVPAPAAKTSAVKATATAPTKAEKKLTKENISTLNSTSSQVVPPSAAPKSQKKEEDDDEDMASLLNHLLPSGFDDEELSVKAPKNRENPQIRNEVQNPSPIHHFNGFNPSPTIVVPSVGKIPSAPLPWSDEATGQLPASPRKEVNPIQGYGITHPPMQGMMGNPMALWGSPVSHPDPIMGSQRPYPVYPSYSALGGSSAWGAPQTVPSFPPGVPMGNWQSNPIPSPQPQQVNPWKFLPTATNVGNAVPPMQQIQPPSFISKQQNLAPNPHAAPFIPSSMKGHN
eukprot:TRINITY_DN5269_c0_g1_i1.p1 TRINITY_DN5269_c0_g1~~TRINITY_DN5269_c0_g1_i1.p1  ORF type:complete len:1082 (+),score=461.82 TRINITY_DN5269_c0_g1_i1:267-3512(+)